MSKSGGPKKVKITFIYFFIFYFYYCIYGRALGVQNHFRKVKSTSVRKFSCLVVEENSVVWLWFQEVLIAFLFYFILFKSSNFKDV